MRATTADTAPAGESIATIHAGLSLIDTGDFSGAGPDELLIAKALKGAIATPSRSA